MKKVALLGMMIAMMAVLALGCGKSPDSDGSLAASGDAKKEKLTIGIDDKFAPMGFRDDKNEIVGFDIDYARAAAEVMGYEAVFQPIDWKAKEAELGSGRIDLIWNGYTITDDRKEKVLFTKPYLKNSQVVVVAAKSSIVKLSELAGKEVGLQSLSSAADALDGNPVKAQIKKVTEFPDNVLALSDLKIGRVDAVVIDEIVARYHMSKDKGAFKLLEESLAPEEYGIGVKKGNEELLGKLQKALDELNKNGKAAEISTKWFGENKVLQ
ncbi:MAG: amino acid transporter substrate-binding protein [Paenibacillaceae bacterium]|jgi:polar amino acid transport system substrate-binding protein|nr:amino acid transporter substrate-binding protein [Paenibacillaceae bacterium]